MKLLIDIPYEAYYTFKCDLEKGNPNLNALAEIVANGTPITEGDLISREWLLKRARYTNALECNMYVVPVSVIDNAPTVDLKDIYQEGHYDGQLEGYTRAINEETPKGEWIPVSERLPNDDEPYEVLCCDNHGEMIIGHPFADEASACGYSAENEGCFMYECVAWKLLPEPYKKGGAK